MRDSWVCYLKGPVTVCVKSFVWVHPIVVVFLVILFINLYINFFGAIYRKLVN